MSLYSTNVPFSLYNFLSNWGDVIFCPKNYVQSFITSLNWKPNWDGAWCRPESPQEDWVKPSFSPNLMFSGRARKVRTQKISPNLDLIPASASPALPEAGGHLVKTAKKRTYCLSFWQGGTSWSLKLIKWNGGKRTQASKSWIFKKIHISDEKMSGFQVDRLKKGKVSEGSFWPVQDLVRVIVLT